VKGPLTTKELRDEASIVPVYPEEIFRDATVGETSRVQFFVLVPSNRAPPVEIGAVSAVQLAASDQLFVVPPPSQILDG
jgi:hypothetical protein